jgi:hypothetical protein
MLEVDEVDDDEVDQVIGHQVQMVLDGQIMYGLQLVEPYLLYSK